VLCIRRGLFPKAEKGFDSINGALDLEIALALARAARDTFKAEEAVMLDHINECKLHLEVLEDTAENACARTKDANYQLGEIFSIVTRHGISINHSTQKFRTSSTNNVLSTNQIIFGRIQQIMVQ
jgi:hypothetical protein